MRVSVRLFASYRERVGKQEVVLELPEGATVGYLAEEVVRLYPALVTRPERLVVAVNYEYREHAYALDDGDEAALIPSVSGGGPQGEEAGRRRHVGADPRVCPGPPRRML